MRALSFGGRAGIGEFWQIHIGVFVLAFLSGAIVRKSPLVALGFTVLYGWVGTAVSVRRLHDRDMSGWYVLIAGVPLIGWFWWLAALGLSGGTPGPNRYGPPES